MKSIQELRAAFKAQETTGENLPNNYYPFWNMNFGEQATIRLLPDANDNNPMGFLVEKRMHNLTVNGERKSVPCLSMYQEDCPVCKVSQAYYKAKDENNGKKYWRKRQYIAQALVVEDPLPADQESGETHQGKVRFISLGYSLFNIVKEALESGELEEIPFAYKGGTDFIIKKTKKGDYADYTLSKFARKESDLDDDTIAMVKENLVDLSTLLPNNPGAEHISALLEADMSGGSVSETSEVEEVATTRASGAEAAASVGGEDEDDVDKVLAQIRERKAKAKGK